MNTKKILVPILLLFFLPFPISAQKKIKKNTKPKIKEVAPIRGYLGFEVDLKVDFLSTQIVQQNNLNVKQDSIHFLLPLRFIANTGDYKIDMNMELFSDFVRIANYYRHNPEFLKQNELYQFSFFNLDMAYSVFHNQKNFSILLGGKFSHYGFLSPYFSTTKVYVLSISPLVKIRWIITNFVLLSFDLEIPIALYQHNLKRFFQIRSTLYFTFDPFQNIGVDLSKSKIFYSIGIEIFYATMLALDKYDIKQLNLRPFVKLSFGF